MTNDHDLASVLSRAFPDNADHLRRLHDRLEATAQTEGILDVAYRTVDSLHDAA